MGLPKGLVRVDGRPWLEHQLNATERLGLGPTIVVLGYEHARYIAEMESLAARAVIAVNGTPERGSFASLQVGLAHVVGNAPTFVLPIDVPSPTRTVWITLMAALDSRLDAVAPVHEGRGGHPVLLSPSFVKKLLETDRDARLDFELRRADVARVLVEDAYVRLNLNSPADWEAFAAHRGSAQR
jgi:molybdenum cofactor cytidylyltransferase